MSLHCKLLILVLALTLDGQDFTFGHTCMSVHKGEIIGVREALPHSRPYMVLLEQHMPNGKTQHCGGFLLNEDFVMTAAQCQGSSYSVLLGVHDVRNSNGIQRISVEQPFPHKDYNETDYSNDIMLLKLSSKAKFSKNVRPIALAGQGDGSRPKSCIISGWGAPGKDKPYMSVVLMEATVTIIHSKQCSNANVYCTEGETGTRKGDAGIPLVCEDGKAYGVASLAGENIYTYAKIPDYRIWIDSIMNQH